MALSHRPALRAHLELTPWDHHRQQFLLGDLLRLSPWALRLSAAEAGWLSFFNGRHTLDEIRQAAAQQVRQNVALDVIGRFTEQLDRALFLEGEAFSRLLHAPVRPPSCIGVYEEDPEALRRQFHALFVQPGGPGLPIGPTTDGELRAMLLPHMDYARGWRVYARGFKALVESTSARLFVILATSHHSRHRFTLTRKHFQTPLGVVETDQTYMNRLVEAYGDGLFDDEALAHFPEHSVELEVVLLRYLYDGTPFRIVPLVIGSFHDCVVAGRDPLHTPDVARMVAALQEAERQTPEPICYLISGDLAHLGPKFGDRQVVEERLLRHSASQDRALLRQTEAADPEGYFDVIARERDERRVCGFAPTYLTLAAVRPARGRVLAYEQFVATDRQESVAFAAVRFDR